MSIGPSVLYPLKGVELFEQPEDLKRWGVELPVSSSLASDFPAYTLVSVDTNGEVVNFDAATKNFVLTQEASNDLGLNIEAGTQLFVGRKSKVYAYLIGSKRVVVTAKGRILQTSDIGKTVDLALDSATGFVYADLSTAGTGTQATILEWQFIPDGPRPFDSTLSDDQRLNARVVIEFASGNVYTP